MNKKQQNTNNESQCEKNKIEKIYWKKLNSFKYENICMKIWKKYCTVLYGNLINFKRGIKGIK
jgi:hypothetical protein